MKERYESFIFVNLKIIRVHDDALFCVTSVLEFLSEKLESIFLNKLYSRTTK